MFMRFGLYPGSATSNPVLAMCNTSSKVFFWDLARLGEYHDYINSINSVTAPEPVISPDGVIEPPVEGVKRPAFLIPYKYRARRGLHVLSRVARETSPTESISTDSNYAPSDKNPQAPTDVGAQPRSHPTPANQQSLIPGLAPADAAKSLEIWSKRYSIGDPYDNLTSHKDEAVKGFGFVGRQIAWSKGGEWCVVVGSGGLIGVFERWQK
jgi:polycomb protein EED